MAYRTPKHVQEQKEAKRLHILETALKVFAEKGFHETSIQDICREAEISVGSIYFYFPNKEEVFETIYCEILNSLSKTHNAAVKGEKSLKKIIEKGIQATVEYMTTTPYIAKFFRMNNDVYGIKQKRDDIFNTSSFELKEIFDEALKDEKIKPINTELASMIVAGSVYYLIRYWNYSGDRINVKEMTDFLVQYNLRGLGING